MKQRVFWKILVGFWITSLLISQAVWLMFVILRPPETPIDTAPFVSSAVIALLEREGGPRLRQDISRWPGFWRQQVEIVPSSKDSPGTIRGGDGQSYRIIIHPPPVHHRHNHYPFDQPWQVMVASVIGSLAFSGILAAYLTAPVGQLRAGFKRLAEGDFNARLGPLIGRRRDEIADLALDFDAMAARLQELVTHRDRLLAGVSHELRSPLARLQLAIGLALKYPDKTKTSLERISSEARKLDEMVEELLTLARLESGVESGDQYIDLAEIVRQIAEDAQFEGSSKGVGVTSEVRSAHGHELIFAGNGTLISRAIENIVRNALRFSKQGQTVHISLIERDHSFLITVQDEGPGIATQKLEWLFQPFVKGNGEDGGGFGLGLAIAQRAIRAHQGSITARNRPEGGFEICIALPVCSHEGTAPFKNDLVQTASLG